MIKFFNLSKNNKKTDAQPDYRISFKTQDTFVEGGACWKKTDKNGQTFLSCKLGDAWMDGGNGENNRKGYHIEEDTKEQALEQATTPRKPKNAPETDF